MFIINKIIYLFIFTCTLGLYVCAFFVLGSEFLFHDTAHRVSGVTRLGFRQCHGGLRGCVSKRRQHRREKRIKAQSARGSPPKGNLGFKTRSIHVCFIVIVIPLKNEF